MKLHPSALLYLGSLALRHDSVAATAVAFRAVVTRRITCAAAYSLRLPLPATTTAFLHRDVSPHKKYQSRLRTTPSVAVRMSWKQTWDDILAGGSPRWKVDDDTAKATALGHIVRHLPQEKAAKIFCPLAGDDPFVRHAHLRGHSVVAMDLVPAAVSAMRGQFGAGETSWAKEASGGAIVWKHESGRATLYEGDAFAKRPELGGTFDAVYDKDSFGALDLSMRGKLCERLAEYCKDGAVVYVEVKAKDENHPGRHAGPPFHVGKDDLMQQGNFGTSFEYVEDLGEVYPIGVPQMRQTGHVLKRKPRS